MCLMRATSTSPAWLLLRGRPASRYRSRRPAGRHADDLTPLIAAPLPAGLASLTWGWRPPHRGSSARSLRRHCDVFVARHVYLPSMVATPGSAGISISVAPSCRPARRRSYSADRGAATGGIGVLTMGLAPAARRLARRGARFF